MTINEGTNVDHQPSTASPENTGDTPSLPALLTIQDLAAMLKMSKRTVERRVADGSLPKPITIGPRILRWRTNDIEKWLRSLGAA